MDLCFLDLETRSKVSVRDVGAYRYAEEPSTEVICCAVAINDEPVEVFDYYSCTMGLEQCLGPVFAAPGRVFVAHNQDFERCVLSKLLGPWILDLPWEDTAARAAAMSLPRKLEDLGLFFWPTDPALQKDKEGSRVMLQLSMPRRSSKANPDLWWTPETKPEAFDRLYSYCAQDVEVSRRVYRKTLDLSPTEDRVWRLTERMSRGGVQLDTESLPLAQAHLEARTSVLAARFEELTGCVPKSPVRVAQALGLPDARRPTIRKALRDPATSAHDLEALRLLQQLSGAATSKLAAMANRVSADGWLRGAITYAGAERTARWSSMGVQLQNLKRGLGKETETAFSALKLGVLDELFDGCARSAPDPAMDPISVLAEMLRGFLIGPFKVGDFAQVEARVNAWFAGQEDLLDVFRAKGDPYCMMGTKIYGREITKADKTERFMSKVVVLGCGYGLGARRLREMLDEVYGVEIDESFAKRLINVYRQANQKIVAFWGVLERGMRYAISSNANWIKVGPVFMGLREIADELFLFIELPNGRKMWYAHPYLNPKGEIRYFGRDIYRSGKWGVVSTFGGKICENCIQAFSRDLLAHAMLRLDAAGYRIRMTVHDEVIADQLEGQSLEEFERLLTELPEWAAGLPLSAEVFECFRYRK